MQHRLRFICIQMQEGPVKRSWKLPGTPGILALPLLAAAALTMLFVPFGASAQTANEKTFPSPGDAVLALYKAAKSSDSDTLRAIFGSNADKILHTGDDVADRNTAS